MYFVHKSFALNIARLEYVEGEKDQNGKFLYAPEQQKQKLLRWSQRE